MHVINPSEEKKKDEKNDPNYFSSLCKHPLKEIMPFIPNVHLVLNQKP